MKLLFDTLIYIVYTCTRCISCIHQRFPDRTKKKQTKILLPLKFLFFSNIDQKLTSAHCHKKKKVFTNVWKIRYSYFVLLKSNYFTVSFNKVYNVYHSIQWSIQAWIITIYLELFILKINIFFNIDWFKLQKLKFDFHRSSYLLSRTKLEFWYQLQKKSAGTIVERDLATFMDLADCVISDILIHHIS